MCRPLLQNVFSLLLLASFLSLFLAIIIPVRSLSPSPDPGQSEQPNPPQPAPPAAVPDPGDRRRPRIPDQPRRKAAARAGFSGVCGGSGPRPIRSPRLAPGAGGSEGELLPRCAASDELDFLRPRVAVAAAAV